MRRFSKQVNVGGVLVGGNAAISVQSMLTRKLSDEEGCLSDIARLKECGCDIVRIALSTEGETEAYARVVKSSALPVVADIQQNHRLALFAIECGSAAIRINPRYIGGEENVLAVARAAKEHKTPIRVGVNLGSLEREIEDKYGRSAEALALSCYQSIKMLEKYDFTDIVASVKASDVGTCVSANRILAKMCDYPIHIGVTEAGTLKTGIIKNAIGVGALLLDGIGDTIRVSLSADVFEEVKAARDVLKSLNLLPHVEVVSCPTCSRCNYDVFSLAEKVERETENLNVPLKVAVMGCVVNGIGEGKDADVGIAGGGEGKFVLFRNGEQYKTFEGDPEKALMDEVRAEIEKRKQK